MVAGQLLPKLCQNSSRNRLKIYKTQITENNYEDCLFHNILMDPLRKEQEGKVREVGPQAVWSLSSCKPGFGVDQLRDKWLETYWQSDGPQPHLVNIQFRKKTTIQDVYLYADYKLDESYTPNRISIRTGTHFHDLHEIEVVELNEPSGWIKISLRDAVDQPIRTYIVQIAILSNHQNGRDTHLRQIRVHSPVENQCFAAIKFPMLTSVECAAYSVIR